jgi:hypothetical protein
MNRDIFRQYTKGWEQGPRTVQIFKSNQSNIFSLKNHGKVDLPGHKVKKPLKMAVSTILGSHHLVRFNNEDDPETVEWIIKILECRIGSASHDEEQITIRTTRGCPKVEFFCLYYCL